MRREAALDEAERAGIDRDALHAIAYAYRRGVGRVAAADAEIIRR